jgi:hypothetical protein
MKMATRWSATNRLVQQLRRHGALATLFRAPLVGDAGGGRAPAQWVLGRVAVASPEDDPATAPAPDAWLPSTANAAQIGASASQEATGGAAALLWPQPAPVQRASVLPTPGAQTVSPPPTRPAQANSAHASPELLSGTPFAPATTAAAPDGSDQSWQRLQRIRRRHEAQLAAAQDTMASAAALQRASAPEALAPPPPATAGAAATPSGAASGCGSAASG